MPVKVYKETAAYSEKLGMGVRPMRGTQDAQFHLVSTTGRKQDKGCPLDAQRGLQPTEQVLIGIWLDTIHSLCNQWDRSVGSFTVAQVR